MRLPRCHKTGTNNDGCHAFQMLCMSQLGVLHSVPTVFSCLHTSTKLQLAHLLAENYIPSLKGHSHHHHLWDARWLLWLSHFCNQFQKLGHLLITSTGQAWLTHSIESLDLSLPMHNSLVLYFLVEKQKYNIICHVVMYVHLKNQNPIVLIKNSEADILIFCY